MADPAALAARPRARPAWRGAGSEEFGGRMAAFDGWLRADAAATDAPMALVDTSILGPDETADRVATWVGARASGTGRP